MAHSLSAKKRIRQNEKARRRNNWRKRQVRGSVKEFQELILHGSVEDAETSYKQLSRTLDKVASKGTIHKKTAARTKSRLAAKLNSKKAEASA